MGDPTAHGVPLNGVGCPTVLIGGQPAWRALVPGAAGGAGVGASAVASLQGARATTDAAILVAETATKTALASGVPPAIATAKATEESVKAASAASMSALMLSTAASLAAAGGGPPDLTTCPVPLPLPPHGPGMVTAGSATVAIGGYLAARMGDQIVEALGPPNSILSGLPTVMIG